MNNLPEYPAPMSPLLSPSLAKKAADRAAAKEVKYLLSETAASQLEERAQQFMKADPYSDGNGGYRLASIYCDTPAWDVFLRNGRHRYCKFRVRRYGDSSSIHLERKVKKGSWVRKKRSEVALSELDSFNNCCDLQSSEAKNYRRQLTRNAMRPVCLITYQRTAFFGESDVSPSRLTLDRRVVGARIQDWKFDMPQAPHLLVPGHVICEFKFQHSMPLLFKQWAQEFQLSPVGFSKYRNCVEVFRDTYSEKAG